MQLKYGLISADDHVEEHGTVWTQRMSKAKWGERIPHLQTQSDGSQRWAIDGVPAERGPVTEEKQMAGAAYDPRQRLEAMDADGVDYSVLYPTVAGLAGERFGKLADADLELACVQAYNDWLIEEWASVSTRLVPQCIVPIWPMERTGAAIRRAVVLGHRGVVYPASPMELKDVPHINELD